MRPGPQDKRPWALLSTDASDNASLEEAYQKGTKLMLYAWAHEDSESRFASLKATGRAPVCFNSILLNGVGRVKCLDEHSRRRLGAPLPSLQPTYGAADVNGCRVHKPSQSLVNSPQCPDANEQYPVV